MTNTKNLNTNYYNSISCSNIISQQFLENAAISYWLFLGYFLSDRTCWHTVTLYIKYECEFFKALVEICGLLSICICCPSQTDDTLPQSHYLLGLKRSDDASSDLGHLGCYVNNWAIALFGLSCRPTFFLTHSNPYFRQPSQFKNKSYTVLSHFNLII